MKQTIVIASFSLIISVGLAHAGAAEGKELYTSKCQPCHGAGGEGKAAIAKMLNVTMPHLGSKEVQAKSDEDLKKVVTTGKGKMKPTAGVTEKQAADIVSYLRTLKQ